MRDGRWERFSRILFLSFLAAQGLIQSLWGAWALTVLLVPWIKRLKDKNVTMTRPVQMTPLMLVAD